MTSVIEIITLPIMATVRLEMMVLHHSENCVEEVLTSVIEFITLPIMATVRLEMMVLHHAESVHSCLDCVVRSFGLIVMFLENGRL